MSELHAALNKVRYPTATQKYPVVVGEPLATIVAAARKWAEHQCLPDEADGSVNYPSLDPPEET